MTGRLVRDPLGIILETGMLLTPYCRVLGIPLTGKFLAMSLTAHLVYAWYSVDCLGGSYVRRGKATSQ